MTRLVNDPCDNFTAAPWTTAGTPTVVAGGHTGNGFNFPSGSGNTITYTVAAGNQTDTFTVGGWFKFATFPALQQVVQFRTDAGATLNSHLTVASGGILGFRVGAITPVSSAPGTIVVGTWYYIEVSTRMHDTLGTATIKVNGVTVASGTSLDTRSATVGTVIDAITIASAASISPWQVDDIYIRNDATFGSSVAMKAYTGAAFVDCPVKVWNGSAFVDALAVKTWNGSAFV